MSHMIEINAEYWLVHTLWPIARAAARQPARRANIRPRQGSGICAWLRKIGVLRQRAKNAAAPSAWSQSSSEPMRFSGRVASLMSICEKRKVSKIS